MTDGIRIRREAPGDCAAVRFVNERAFGRPSEADLVDALRSAGAATLSLVALRDEAVVGHILFSPVTIASPEGDMEALGLGPMAVPPACQRAGIGSMLVREGLSESKRLGFGAVVVLGHATYYPRFGFRRASAFGVRWEQDAPDEAFMLLELAPGILAGRGGVVRYRPEFAAV